MNGSNLYDYIFHIEAPLRERAAAEAAQREQALQGRGARQETLSVATRVALGKALVSVGRSIQGRQGRQAPALEDRAEAAT